MRRHSWIAALFVAVTVTLTAQDLRYLQYDTDLTPPEVYRARRDTLRAKMGPDAVAFFFAPSIKMRNGDQDYPFRQEDNLYYLTGIAEPNCLLVLSTRGMNVRTDPDDPSSARTVHEVMFVQPRDFQREKWVGRSLGPDGVMQLRGLELALPKSRFTSPIYNLVSGARTLYVRTASAEHEGEIGELWRPVVGVLGMLQQNYSTLKVVDPSSLVHEMRRVKSADEVRLIRTASQISAAAHIEAMASVEPGMTETALEGVYHHVTRKLGAEQEAYPAIVAAGENSVILHYNTNRRPMKNGDLVLVDYGSEYHYYASDVTRTFPVNGVFSSAQREIYQIVLDAQEAALAMIKPGVTWQAVNQRSREVLADGLLKLGLIKDTSPEQVNRFVYHGLGHSVGLNVHDVSTQVLEPGVVYTVEPGIYIAEGLEGVDPKYWNIGVRIEDTIVVTESGHENLSISAPRTIKEIESLMKKKGVGNQPLNAR